MKRFTLFLMLALLVAGCAPQLGQTDVTKMTPEQVATWMMGVYNDQYDAYVTDAANPALTPAQRELMPQRRLALTEAWPLIGLFSRTVLTGQVPPAELQANIIRLLGKMEVK